MRRATFQSVETIPARHAASSSKIVIRWERIAALGVAAVIGFAAGVVVTSSLMMNAVQESSLNMGTEHPLRAEQSAARIAAALDTRCTTDEQDDCWWVRTGTTDRFVSIDGNIYPLPE